ncbi:hypothetical protein [Rhizorhabdus sp. FW153]|uniref:hypothetical protein n=1 Tax=Rhizorhabdus sp. FW153 TaxID=3400216 RepID=UPI003CF9572E
MVWTFDPPGNVPDFVDPARWHAVMAAHADDMLWQLAAHALDNKISSLTAADLDHFGPALAYAHPLYQPVPPNAETVALKPWSGFPRFVDRHAPWPLPPIPHDLDGSLRTVEDLGDHDYAPGRFVDGDGDPVDLPVRHRQNEYLEWAARRGADGRLSSITFVAEGHDYFSALFDADERAVVELYQRFTGVPGITADALRARTGIWRVAPTGERALVARPGGYNYRNPLNIDPGIVHLSHHANSLIAQISVAGVSGLIRLKADGTLVSGIDAEELLCCNRGGDPNRNSDPKISQQAYTLTRNGYRYTLANPVGVYISGVDEQSITLPDGKPLPREWWTAVRGRDLWSDGGSRVLRLEIAPPPGETIGLEDLKVNGSALRFPGQVARLIGVHLFVTRWKRETPGTGPSARCLGTCCCAEGKRVLLRDDHGRCRPGTKIAFPGLISPVIEDLGPHAPAPTVG